MSLMEGKTYLVGEEELFEIYPSRILTRSFAKQMTARDDEELALIQDKVDVPEMQNQKELHLVYPLHLPANTRLQHPLQATLPPPLALHCTRHAASLIFRSSLQKPTRRL